MDDGIEVKQEVLEDLEDPLNDIKPCSVVLKREFNDYNEDDDEVEEPYDEEDLDSSSSEEDSDSDYDYKRSKNSRSRRSSSRKTYNDDSDLDTHEKVTCLGCQRTFRSQPNLNKHLGHFKNCRKLYEESGELPACFSINPSASSAQDQGDFECQKCSRRFTSEGGLNKHVSKIKKCKEYYERLNGVVGINTEGLTARQSYYKRNREKVIARQKEYYHRNAHKVKERRNAHYRNKVSTNGNDSNSNQGPLISMRRTSGYMERYKDYYEKNKESIKERRRSYYHIKKEALNKKVGKYEFAKISSLKNLAEIPDPYEAYGQVLINIPPPIAPIKALTKHDDLEDDDLEDDKISSPLTHCLDFQNIDNPGDSKLNLDDLEELTTMPKGSSFNAKLFDYSKVQHVQSFVGLTLSKDQENLEVCHLLDRKNINLENMRKLVHAVLSVISIDLKTFVQEKSCPVHLFEVKHMHLLKDKLSRDLLKLENVLPETSIPLCVAKSSTETEFLDDSMESEIPAEQLLVNENLVCTDLAAIGVLWRIPEEPDKIRINPIFTINNPEHWRYKLRDLYTLLVNWVGGKISLNQIIHMLPCMITAKESFFDEVRLDCHNELLKPMESKVCEHCGEVFKFSKYTLQSRRAYARHVQLHDHNCKICGETFPNGTQRKFHERSHKEHSVSCPEDKCHYVGSSQQAVDTHVKHAHSTLVCDLCGKVTVAQNLKLHMATHHAPKTFEFVCTICGKGYSTKNILDKHIKRHNNPDSLINKWMTESKEFKFECKEHENCKRFFKSEKRLKEHLKRYGGKPYPANLARQYVPTLPEDHSTIIDSTMVMAKKNSQDKSKIEIPSSDKNKPFKKRKKDDDNNEPFENVKVEHIAPSPHLTEDNSTSDSIYQPPPTLVQNPMHQNLYPHLYPPGFHADMYHQRTFRPFPASGTSPAGSDHHNASGHGGPGNY